MNNHSAYFPRTKLILGGGGTVELGPNFHWIQMPEIVSGVETLQMSQEQLLKRLQG
eukprot:CAMPEP_0170060904 /NCGR_PEP_ID=MMETSP0019_2-20121128/2677_1 /TAXON_ID=98059 /ORGANISM="Dinobryon sp., Strain UTEXLB2267" /LENGTH=55 /DNA_ID=CAMNT_0010266611 /DNA_START=982 /DNA_END=1149 /DNA_ORIENTATION=-